MRDRQWALLLSVRRYWQQHGYAPSLVDLGNDTGITAKSVVRSNLDGLQKRGWVTWEPHRARTIRLTAEGFAMTERRSA